MNKINDKDYKVLTPFKGWVLENFPFIEANFDAITNYELYCKIVEYLNNVIYNQNQVQDLGTELVNGYNDVVDYVNNYFDNLDVQEEINVKLDLMAEDGTLTNLIKGYIDPLIAEQNERIDDFETEIRNIASGSPLVASSTDGMTDTSRTYVNTTNGNWYYYDGTTWQIGGTYQSTGIGINSIHYDNLDTKLQKQIKLLEVETGSYTISGKCYYGNVGDTIGETTLANYECGNMNVSATDTIYVPYLPKGLSFTANLFYFTDNDGKIIEKHTYPEVSTLLFADSEPVIFAVPSNATKLYFNNNANTSNNEVWYPFKIKSYNYADDRIDNYMTATENKIASATLSNKVYSLYGFNIDLNNFKTTVFDVKPLEKININATIIGNANYCAGIFFDEDDKPVGYVPPFGNETTSVNVDAIVPPNASSLYISTASGSNPIVKSYVLSDTDSTAYKKLNVTYSSGTLTITNNENNNNIVFKNFGGNNLFMIYSYKIGSNNITTYTDMTPAPYIVKAVNNADGDKTSPIYTGGNHQWNNQGSGSTATARQIGVAIYCDDRLITGNTNTNCNNVKIIETNRIQGWNTCKEDGTGREILEEKIVFNFDGTKLHVVNTIHPLEDIVINRYYGIQIALFSNDTYKIYADKLYNYSTQNSVTEKPFAIYGNSIVCSKLSDGGLGDYSFNTTATKVIIGSSKAYYVPVYDNETVFNSSNYYYIDGEYIFDNYQI